MKLIKRIEVLESHAPKCRKRVILVWIGHEGHTTKVADSDPHLPDDRLYDDYLSPYQPGGGIRNDAAQTY